MKKHGLLLINLGTPEAPTPRAVKTYLHEFLMDARVISLPYVIRAILVYGIIGPFRSKKSAHSYQEIWTTEGSPLALHTQKMTFKLAQKLEADIEVAYAMRYGQPSIALGLEVLKHCEKITILPLYPQYASATSASSIEAVFKELSKWQVLPNLEIIRDFYQHPAYQKALAESIRPFLDKDYHLLLSYHGLPENQLKTIGCKPICHPQCNILDAERPGCYRFQCYQTSSNLVKQLGLDKSQYSISFQSRLGKTPWIKPYTDHTIASLAEKGIKNLNVACPSFMVDCLETLEEIGMAAREQWKALGGENFKLIPCLNSQDIWIDALKEIVNG